MGGSQLWIQATSCPMFGLPHFSASSWHPVPRPQIAHLLPKKRFKAGGILHGVRQTDWGAL